MLILYWFKITLHPAKVSWQNCSCLLKLMTSQVVEGTQFPTGSSSGANSLTITKLILPPSYAVQLYIHHVKQLFKAKNCPQSSHYKKLRVLQPLLLSLLLLNFLLLACSFSHFLFSFAGAILRLSGVKKYPDFWPFFTQMTANFVRFSKYWLD